MLAQERRRNSIPHEDSVESRFAVMSVRQMEMLSKDFNLLVSVSDDCEGFHTLAHHSRGITNATLPFTCQLRVPGTLGTAAQG